MFERFTDRARQALVLAQRDAVATGATSISTAHLLVGLADVQGGIAERVLRSCGLDAGAIRSAAERLDEPGSATPPPPPAAELLSTVGVDLAAVREKAESSFGEGAIEIGAAIPFSALAKASLERALLTALGWGHNFIGTEHLLAGVIDDPDSAAHRLVRSSGVSVGRVTWESLLHLLRLPLALEGDLAGAGAIRAVIAGLDGPSRVHAEARFEALLGDIAAAMITAAAQSLAEFDTVMFEATTALADKIPGEAPVPPPGSLSLAYRVWVHTRMKSGTDEQRRSARDAVDGWDAAVDEARSALMGSVTERRARPVAEAVEAAAGDLRGRGIELPII